jgi:hypothetical protein
MKRRYANGRTKKKVLYELELDTLDRLDKIMKEQIFASRKKERMKAVAVNPFLAMMYKSMSFNVWRDIYGKKYYMNYLLTSIYLCSEKFTQATSTHITRT